ncbi:Ger(x)C family spore germination protein [Candidatus Contubernalis alkaliaceticus]|uniref:Ger(x)C family spore germination protein n=1 Tax=Candidatus Contubernalis alkaliaceticus TaxID=338645 RepID=UPI001F4C4667|nr:Ger(x)C family spore germination protein [Candidatus Contubernalis alkalaceticus]UNC91011.1 Ger(x)C family spore germination protein [Candidatus Contubernalis alkalaceticus]
MKKIVALFLLLFFFCAGGCWDWRIIDQQAILFGIGIDPVETDPEVFRFTFVNPTFTPEAEDIRVINMVTGFSLDQALMNLQHQKDQRPAIGKVNILLFSEEIARNGGMHKIMRQWDQIRENNPNALLCIIRGASARDVFILKVTQQPRVAVFLTDLLEQNIMNGRAPRVTASNYWFQYHTRGISPVVPIIELTGTEDEKTGIILAGLAVVDERGRMRGSITDNETIMYMLLTDNIQRGRIYTKIDFAEQKDRLITAFIQKNSSKVNTKIVNDKPVININMEISIDGLDADLYLDTHLKGEVFSGLEQALARNIQGNVLRVLKKTQGWESDIMGLGQHVRVQNARWFKGIDWPKEYGESEIHVEVSVKIKRMMDILNPNY